MRNKLLTNEEAMQKSLMQVIDEETKSRKLGDKEAQRLYNMKLRRMADEMSTAAPKIWPGERTYDELSEADKKLWMNAMLKQYDVVQGEIKPY